MQPAGLAAAFVWGLVSGGALFIGAAIAWFSTPRPTVVAAFLAFGSGILISTIAFDLMQQAYAIGGVWAVTGGFIAGALLFTLASSLLKREGAAHRKSSEPPPHAMIGSGGAIAIATVLDSIPEAVIIGLSLIGGGAVKDATILAIVVSNIPEGLSSTAGMKASGRRITYVIGLWAAVTICTAIASVVGYIFFHGAPPRAYAVVASLSAGALLGLVADTMIPEAFAKTQNVTGFVAALGFLAGFTLSHVVP